MKPRSIAVVGAAATGRVDEEVVERVGACSGARQEEPATGQAGEARFAHGGGEPGGHHCVEGVAPMAQHLGGSLGGPLVACGDHPVRGASRHVRMVRPGTGVR